MMCVSFLKSDIQILKLNSMRMIFVKSDERECVREICGNLNTHK